MNIYVVGSLRKPETEEFAKTLESMGHEPFVDWRAAGPRADDEWREFFQRMGKSYSQALFSDFVQTFVNYDGKHIDWSDVVIGLNPTGLSAGLELFYAAVTGKPTIAYYSEQPARWDGMWLLIFRMRPGARFWVAEDMPHVEQLLGHVDVS